MTSTHLARSLAVASAVAASVLVATGCSGSPSPSTSSIASGSTAATTATANTPTTATAGSSSTTTTPSKTAATTPSSRTPSTQGGQEGVPATFLADPRCPLISAAKLSRATGVALHATAPTIDSCVFESKNGYQVVVRRDIRLTPDVLAVQERQAKAQNPPGSVVGVTVPGAAAAYLWTRKARQKLGGPVVTVTTMWAAYAGRGGIEYTMGGASVSKKQVVALSGAVIG